MTDVLGPLGVSKDEIKSVIDSLEQEKIISGQICACGHARKHHRDVELTGEIYCKAAKFECSCVAINPVLQVSDARFFMRKSLNKGPETQALTLGIFAVMEENEKRSALAEDITGSKKKSARQPQITMEWMENPVACQMCGITDIKLAVAPTTRDTGKRFHMDPKPTDKLIYVLLCSECGD